MKKGSAIAVFLILLMALGVGPAFAAKGGIPGPPDNGGGGGGGGGGNGGGGGPGGSGDKKGGLYGDLYVIVRNDLGIPTLYTWQGGEPFEDQDYGFLQPIASNGELIPLDAEGEVLEGYADMTQEVEFGRLNLGRSPEDTLKAAFAETCKNVAAADEVALDTAGRLVMVMYSDTGENEIKTVDSPRENLALYQQLMIDGDLSDYDSPVIDYPDTITTMAKPAEDPDPVFAFKAGAVVDPDLWSLVDGNLTIDDLDLAAPFFAAAADKFGNITVDMVIYLNAIIGVNHGGLTGGTLTLDSEHYYREYFNFTGFDYSRQERYPGEVTYIISNGDGTYRDVTEPIMDAVFDGVNYSNDGGTPVKNFAQAIDDARRIIAFTHDVVQAAVTELQINKMK